MRSALCAALGSVLLAFALSGCGGAGITTDGDICSVGCLDCDKFNRLCRDCKMGMRLTKGRCSHIDPNVKPDNRCGIPSCTKCKGSSTCAECQHGFILEPNASMCKAPSYTCQSTMDLSGQALEMDRKGLTLDDTTFRWCASKIPVNWPNTNIPLKSLRLFKAWQEDWVEWDTQKIDAWESLTMWVKQNGVQVLIGTQISCSEQDDDADWENVKQLLAMIGPDNVMGLAVGNEMELLWQKKGTTDECLRKIWDDGYFFEKFQQRVTEFDALGMQEKPVTTVMGGYATIDFPWIERKNPKDGYALFGTFIKNVVAAYPTRFAFTVNIYGYFDTSRKADVCTAGLEHALCFSANDPQDCYFTALYKVIRQRMQAASGNLLWIGETGWSAPKADTLSSFKQYWCDSWSTTDSLKRYYQNFISWDMNTPEVKGPDHIFYFTIRDSTNFNLHESFGLIGGPDSGELCDLTTCKLQAGDLSVNSSHISVI